VLLYAPQASPSPVALKTTGEVSSFDNIMNLGVVLCDELDVRHQASEFSAHPRLRRALCAERFQLSPLDGTSSSARMGSAGLRMTQEKGGRVGDIVVRLRTDTIKQPIPCVSRIVVLGPEHVFRDGERESSTSRTDNDATSDMALSCIIFKCLKQRTSTASAREESAIIF